MLTAGEYRAAQKWAFRMLREVHILITDQEVETMQLADFGLSRLEIEGAQIVIFVETERIGVKVIALFPGQTLPEHFSRYRVEIKGFLVASYCQ
jgi:D-lyxose ketol-isomerase